MAELKTKPTEASVEAFLAKVPAEVRKDCEVVMDMMATATGDPPKMWGPAIIGFGQTKLKNASTGKETDWFRIGFSPRKAYIALYLSGSLSTHASALKKLGKHKTAVSCLYIKRLADVNLEVLRQMIDKVKG